MCQETTKLSYYFQYVEKQFNVNLFVFFIKLNLISSNQSSFTQGDSRLLSITHETYQSFDDGFETRAIFLDISKTFDKVWHKGLTFNLK